MYIHGKNNTPLYHRWEGMIQRTTNPRNKSYKLYGGRGILICDEWRNDFMNFYNWAMQNGYHPSLSLDRIDVNKGYNPENCRWVSAKIQSNNKTNNIFVNINGLKLTLSEVSQIYNIPVTTLWGRYTKGDEGVELIRPIAANKGKFIKGRSNVKHFSKLTADDVLIIKRNIINDNLSNKIIAMRFGVSPSTINDIRRGRTWKRITINQDNTELTK